MKRLKSIGLTLFIFVISSLQILLAQDCNCTHTLENDSSVLINIFDSKDFNYNPGNVFCLKAGNWSGVRFLGFKGTAKKPIIFKNYAGKVIITTKIGEAIKFVDCKNFALKGNGSIADSFGIQINKVDQQYNAVKLDNVGAVEISHLALVGGGVGDGISIYLNDNYLSQKRHALNLHNNKIINFKDKGISIASYQPTFIANNQPGKKKHKTRIVIKNNQLANLGDNAIEGDIVNATYRIKGNIITNNTTVSRKDSAKTIFIENANNVLIHNNKLINEPSNYTADLAGIFVKNIANHLEIYNNLLVNPGVEGIIIEPKLVNAKDWKGYYGINNTIVGSEKTGIHFIACEHLVEKEDCNHNVAYGFYNNLIVQQNLESVRDYDYIKMTGWHKDPNLKEANNYFASSFEGLALIDTLNGHFELKANSPLINAGKQVDQFNIMKDIEGNPRPAEGVYDIGCYEFKRSLPKNKTAKEQLEVMAFPNFENDKLILINTSKNSIDDIQVGVYNSLSQKIDEICLKPNFNEINMQQYNGGIYYIIIRTVGTLQTLRFVKS